MSRVSDSSDMMSSYSSDSASAADSVRSESESAGSDSSDMECIDENNSARPAAALCKFLAPFGITTKSKIFYSADAFACENLPPNLFTEMWRHLKRHRPRSIESFDDFLRQCGIASTERIVFVHDGKEFETLDGKWKDMWRSHLSRQQNGWDGESVVRGRGRSLLDMPGN